MRDENVLESAYDRPQRIGFLTLVTFLGINSREFDATDEEVVSTMMALADGA